MDLSIRNCVIALHKIDGVDFLFSQHCCTPMITVTMKAMEVFQITCAYNTRDHLHGKQRKVIRMNGIIYFGRVNVHASEGIQYRE